MANLKITVPDMGDFKDVEVIEVLVKEGQSIDKNESLITLESDKSSVEVPSTHSGKVDKEHIVAYTLSALAKEQLIGSDAAEKAIKKFKIDKDKDFPIKL